MSDALKYTTYVLMPELLHTTETTAANLPTNAEIMF